MVLTAAGCGSTGSGDIVAEAREIGSFDRIEVSSGIAVEITVDPAAPEGVSLSACLQMEAPLSTVWEPQTSSNTEQQAEPRGPRGLGVQTIDVGMDGVSTATINPSLEVTGRVTGGATLTMTNSPTSRDLDVSGGGNVSG
jgi:hypothetical protein